MNNWVPFVLASLPPPPADKTGWPWMESTPPAPACTPEGVPWPRISIVTPSFNQGQYLEETIRSVLLQGYPNLEYILIDGGSTDGSLEILRKYSPWLTYWVSEADRGQSHAINKGFSRCTGEIITFLSSDDVYLPGTLIDVGARWASWKEYGALIGSFYFFETLPVQENDLRLPRLDHPAPLDLTLYPPSVYRLHQVSTFYNRYALDDVGRWVCEDYNYTMDRELLFRICRSYPIFLVERPYGAFRRHSQGKSKAAILPFAREFARLYLSRRSGNPAEDRLRRKWARHHLAGGYLKHAKATPSLPEGALSLVKAPSYRPDLLMKPGYYSAWLSVLHLRPLVHWIRGFLRFPRIGSRFREKGV